LCVFFLHRRLFYRIEYKNENGEKDIDQGQGKLEAAVQIGLLFENGRLNANRDFFKNAEGVKFYRNWIIFTYTIGVKKKTPVFLPEGQ